MKTERTASDHVTLSSNDHFTFGYDGIPFGLRKRPTQRFFMNFGRCRRLPGGFKDECYATARAIRDATDLPIYVLFSGGIDSEVVVRSFAEQGIAVTAAILQYAENLNLHDISFAVICCEKYKIPYELVPIDLLKFWQGEVYEYAARVQCISPQLVLPLWLADRLDGYPVISGELNLRSHGGNWVQYEPERRIGPAYKHFLLQQRPACPRFYFYTPELILSFMTDPLVTGLINGAYPGLTETLPIKHDIYSQHFDLIRRPKYHGFERVMERDAELRTELTKLNPGADDAVFTPYAELIAMLAPR